MMLTPDDVVTLVAPTSESLDAVITTTADPTGTEPEFALVADVPDADTVWIPGQWAGAWAAGAAAARTPLIGAAAALPIAAGKRYRVWVRFTAGGETPVQPVGSIRVLGTPAGALAPLATLNDLEARLGTTIADPGRAAAVLADVSASVRSLSGQTISRATSTVRLTPNSEGYVRLPQWPVIDILTVTDDNGANVYLFNVTPEAGYVSLWQPVNVTYTHGFDPVPDLVIALVCQIAGRALATPSSSAGISQEALGAYSYSIGAAAAAGPFGLLDSEMKAIRALRRPAQPISMLARPSFFPRFGFY